MLLKSYKKEIFRPECNPSFQSLHMIAHLDEDVAPVLPYLNAVLGGTGYTMDPPSVTFRVHGRLITVHPDRIAVNALADEEEAEKILNWLIGEINDAWENRDSIEPSTTVAEKPKIVEIVRMLPRLSACGKCGRSTCMAFAALVVEGVKGPEDCPPLDEKNRERLVEYLSGFRFEI